MSVITQIPNSWATYKRTPPRGYTVITEKEALDPKNKEILTSARSFIDRNVKAGADIGHREYKEIGGRKIFFIVEPHYHPPGGTTKPWGWHKGATVFVPPANDPFAFLYNAASETAFTGDVPPDFIGKVKKYGPPLALSGLFFVNPIVGGIAMGGLIGKKFWDKKHATKAAPPISPTPAVHTAAVAAAGK